MAVGILGAGSWGWTLAHIIIRGERSNNDKVFIWTRDEKVSKSINEHGVNPKRFPDFPIYNGRVYATTSLEEVFSNCEIILVAVSVSSVREVMRAASRFIEGNHIIVSTSKGFEKNTGKRVSEIIKEESCCRKIGVLSGPNLAREILEGSPSAAVVASNIREVQEKVYSAIHSPLFRIYTSYDVIGVELGGALKNIYAIAAGIADGLGFKVNSLAFLLSRAASEMMKLGVMFGAKRETFFGISGIGDLFATASSDLSRNRRFGKLLVSGKKPDEALKEIGEVVEGYWTTHVAFNMSVELGIKLNIVSALYNVIFLGYDIPTAIRELLHAEVREEF